MSWFKKFFGLEDNEQYKDTQVPPQIYPQIYSQRDTKNQETTKVTQQSNNSPRSKNADKKTELRQDKSKPVNMTDGVIDWYYRLIDNYYPQEGNLQGEQTPSKGREITDEQLEILRSPRIHPGSAIKQITETKKVEENANKESNEGQQSDVVKIDTVTPKEDAQPKIEVVREETKLTIILIENTVEVAKEKEKLEQIVKSLATTGFVCVINYGTEIREAVKIEASSFNSNTILYKDDIGDKACLYDALVTLENVVKKHYKSIVWLKYRRARITNIEIIGIGRCIDNYSFTQKQLAIDAFENTVCLTNATTKYFCLSEDNFIDAANIGFRSIGAITRSY